MFFMLKVVRKIECLVVYLQNKLKRIEKTDEMAKLNKNDLLQGCVETPILYEEADGDWIRLQGKDRRKYGPSREMKIMIAYDGASETILLQSAKRFTETKISITKIKIFFIYLLY